MSAVASDINATAAAMPIGTDLVGTTNTFFSVNWDACCAARIMLVLLGSMNTCLACAASTALTRSSMLGFIV